MSAEVSKDEVLADFQACTGIDDVEVAIIHLDECDWDLLSAINKVLPQHTQTLPSERSSVPGNSVRSFRGFSLMDQDPSESDVSRMEEDDIIVLPPETNGSSTSKEDAIAIAEAMGLDGPFSSSSSSIKHSLFASLSNSKVKEERGSKTASTSANSRPTKVSMSKDFAISGPSGSSRGGSSNREIRFTIRSISNGSSSSGSVSSGSLTVSLAECETIDTLKTLIHAHFEVPPCQQKLLGWPKGDIPTDSAKLGSINLPNEVNLTLISNSQGMDYLSGVKDRSDTEDDKYSLIIRDETNLETHTIVFAGSKTVRGVKEELYTVTDIPVRYQVWIGWPTGTTDNMSLNTCNLEKPHHNLSVKKQVSATSSSADLSKRLMELTDGSETSSDVEDLTESYPLEEDYFVPEISTTPQKFLIPDNAPDEAIGTIQFSDNFFSRYGSCHPMFFHGSLEDAVKEGCMKPAKTRKLLAIYLHHDGSVMSNVFCQQILCNESIVSYLSNNFVVWGWDNTHESNRQMLLAAVNKNFGAPGVGTIRSIERDRYPVIIIVSRVRSATEICSVVYGSTAATVDELMGSLMHTTELYQTQRQSDIREEDEREARERVKREQDEAYEASLMADRAKDEAKRASEEQKMNEEMKQQEAEEQAKMLRDQIATTLPSEPDNNCQDPVCSLKCRLPGGKIVSRRFIHATTLNVLFDYLFTQGFSRDEYRFLTTYPKRDLTNLPETTVMKDVFSPQDTLIVEER